MGGRGNRKQGASGGRRRGVLRHAAELDARVPSTPASSIASAAALEASSITDFGLWGGLVPGNIGEMAELAERGVVGFKAFLCDSGLPEFPRADDFTLWKGLARGGAA